MESSGIAGGRARSARGGDPEFDGRGHYSGSDVRRPRFRLWELEVRPRISPWARVSAPQMFVGSFAALIGVGTLGLKGLPGLYTGAELGWLDAFFTATSAVCVTGLVVVDTATYFTTAGQAFLLALIQLGGLGIITFTTLIILSLGRRLSLRQEILAGGIVDIATEIDRRRLARDIVRFTALFEAVGAVVLYALWVPRFGWRGAIWPALFHSISAFCNAGFSTFSDSLAGFQRAPLTLIVVGALIVAGGLGFLVLAESASWWKAARRGRRFRISLHSQIVLGTTAILVVAGWIGFGLLEWSWSLYGLPVGAKLANALFAGVAPRTAGFYTIDYTQTVVGTGFLTIIFMFIGGSPGSTAGGLKTTTIALIGLLAWNRFRRREVVSVLGRSIPDETVQRAVGLFVFVLGLVSGAVLFFAIREIGAVHGLRGEFLMYVFEAASAFNTVGLSLGVTSILSPSAEWVTIVLMYLGRVGPLSFAAAIALPEPTPTGEFRYAYDDVVVG